jgi:hypothetical protein
LISGSLPEKAPSSTALPLQLVASASCSSSDIGEASGLDDFDTEVLPAFRGDSIGEICRADTTIQEIGRATFHRVARDRKKSTMRDMRRLASIVLDCRKSFANFSGADIFARKNFKMVIACVRRISEGKPSIRVILAHLLRSGAKTMRGTYLAQERDKDADDVKIFNEILDLEWSALTNQAVTDLKLRSQEVHLRPVELPKEDDVSVVRDYTVREIAKLMGVTPWDVHMFNRMRTLLVTRLTLFNSRYVSITSVAD